jgi:hypothetical protein
MPTDPSVPSSDLALASKLASGLAAKAPAPAKKGDELVPPPAAEKGYVRLRRRTVPPPAPPSPEAFGSAAWNDLLDWALAISGGGSAFLVDRHGLVVAWRGAITRDEVEQMGSELAGLVDASARVHGAFAASVRALALDVGPHTVTIALGDDGFALGIVGRQDIGREAREAMVAALARATAGA